LASKDRDQNLFGRRKLLSYFSLRHEYDFLPVSGEIVHLRCHFIQDRAVGPEKLAT